jgi:DDE superfamily endonuclease
LSVLVITRVEQKCSNFLESIRVNTVREINSRFLPGGDWENIPKKYWLNMDQTAILFEPKVKRCVHHKVSNTVSCRASGSNQRRATVCITVAAADGTKLPPFYIFKGLPGATIETKLLENGVLGFCQVNGWFDEFAGRKYVSDILIPYFTKDCREKCIMLDHFKCHLQTSFVSTLSQLGCDVDYIPAGYTCVLQPCDVGINAPLKRSIRLQHSQWCIKKYSQLQSKQKW